MSVLFQFTIFIKEKLGLVYIKISTWLHGLLPCNALYSGDCKGKVLVTVCKEKKSPSLAKNSPNAAI